MAENSVNLRDVYNAVNRIEDKLNERIENLERKVSMLESFQNKALGIITTVSLIFGGLISYFWNKVLPK